MLFSLQPGPVWVSYYCKTDGKIETVKGSSTPAPVCCGVKMTAFMTSTAEPKVAEVQRSVVVASPK